MGLPLTADAGGGDPGDTPGAKVQPASSNTSFRRTKREARRTKKMKRSIKYYKAAPAAVKELGTNLGFFAKAPQWDRENLLDQVTLDASALESAGRTYQSDREIVLTAVDGDGLALQCASKALKADRVIVRAAC